MSVLSLVTTVCQVHRDYSVVHFMYVSVYFDINKLKFCAFLNKCTFCNGAFINIPFLCLTKDILKFSAFWNKSTLLQKCFYYAIVNNEKRSWGLSSRFGQLGLWGHRP